MLFKWNLTEKYDEQIVIKGLTQQGWVMPKKHRNEVGTEVDLNPARRNLLEIIEVLFNYVNYGPLAGHDVNMHPKTEATEAMKDKHGDTGHPTLWLLSPMCFFVLI